jgi:hypothetical protein
MARQLAKFNQAQANATQHAHATEEPQSQVYGSDTIVRESNATRHQGRTFEHKEDEH